MLSLGAVSYPSGLGFGCKAGRWEFESQLDPLLLMLCEESELPWWLNVSLLPEISKKTKQQPKREKKRKGKRMQGISIWTAEWTSVPLTFMHNKHRITPKKWKIFFPSMFCHLTSAPFQEAQSTQGNILTTFERSSRQRNTNILTLKQIKIQKRWRSPQKGG